MRTNLPGIQRGPLKPAIGPQYNPNSPLPQLQPEFNQGRGQARIMTMNSNNSNANTTSNWKQPKAKPSGKRKGGKVKKATIKDTGKPIYPVPFNRGGNNDSYSKSSLTVNQSDFGYNIDGSPSPNDFVDSRDQTLFRDYNERSQLIKSNVDSLDNFFCAITNQFKLLDIDPKFGNNLAGYKSAYIVILDLIKRDVISGTRASAGAIKALDDLENYLHAVTRAFALLTQIESLQAWNPSDNSYFDRSLRMLASKASTVQMLEMRTQLRQVLIPQVLPVGWMKYIKWLYGAHLRNPLPESTKLRFVSADIAQTIELLLKDQTIPDDGLVKIVNDLVNEVRDLNQTLPSIILNNVNCVDFANTKDHYDGMHNSATYDAEWNNVFNNRGILFKSSTAPQGAVTRYPRAKDNYYICLDSDSPYSMVLPQASRQDSSMNPGLPLEGAAYVTGLTLSSDQNSYNRFIITESDSGVFDFAPLRNIAQDNTDSIHRTELGGNNTAITLDTRYSMPAGLQSFAIVASDSNCRMAARESLSNMTLK